MPKSICLIVAMATLCGCGRRAEPVTRPRQDLDVLPDKVDAPEWVAAGSCAGRNRIIVRIPTPGHAAETADHKPDKCRGDDKAKVAEVLMGEKIPVIAAKAVYTPPYQPYGQPEYKIIQTILVRDGHKWIAMKRETTVPFVPAVGMVIDMEAVKTVSWSTNVKAFIVGHATATKESAFWLTHESLGWKQTMAGKE